MRRQTEDRKVKAIKIFRGAVCLQNKNEEALATHSGQVLLVVVKGRVSVSTLQVVLAVAAPSRPFLKFTD